MDHEKASEELKVIRQLMERPIRYSTMSGLSGIWAGCAALAGVFADSYFSFRCNQGAVAAFCVNALIWGGVFAMAFAGTIVLTRLREVKQGMPAWSAIKKRILLTIGPPFVAGAGLTFAIACPWSLGRGAAQWELIPAIWMLFYGVTLWQLGLFSTVEIRTLGWAFIVAGLLSAALLRNSPYLTMGATFGGFHVLYGVVVVLRHGG